MRTGSTFIALAVALLLAAFALPSTLGAQTNIEQIRQYDIAIEIEADGDLLIVEEILYDFGPNSRRGIFRDIIGDPDVYITGVHRYTISYRVEGAFNSFDDHDELFWNAASDWTVPITDISVSVEAPVDFIETVCFAGPSGSISGCDQSVDAAGVAHFDQASIRQWEALTVGITFPPDSIDVSPPILDQLWSLNRAFSRTPFTLGATAILLIAAIGFVIRLVWIHGRDRRFVGSAVEVAFGSPTDETQRVPMFESHGDSAIEFGPPENMQPGLMGTLVDEVAHPLDVTATIIDLAVRGYLSIEEIAKEGWFGKDDWNLKRLKETDDELVGYEQRLLDGIFRDGDEVLLSDLKTEFVQRLKQVQDDLYDEVVDRHWFRRRPDNVRASWIGSGVGAVVVGGLVTAGLAWLTSYALLGLPIILGGLLVIIKAGAMPRRTARGTGMMRRAMGFQRALATAEADAARWAEEQGIFSKYLPYAIVFGLTERWAKAFEGLDQELMGTGAWYVSSRPFTTYAFASSIGSFSTNTVGTIVATPAASGGSGFGGGGFAGGGFGGGGGGSW